MAGNLDLFGEYASIVRRRKYHFLLPAGGIFLLAAVLAFTLPAVYRSTATLLIERQDIPDELVASTVTGYAVEQIQTITQKVTRYDNLWQLAEDLDLYPDQRRPELKDAIVEQVADSIATEMVSEVIADPRTGRPREVVVAFTVSFESEAPEVAQQGAVRLADLYLEENQKDRAQKAKGTSTFLATEAERLNAKIAELETRIAEFKRNNPDLLPQYATMNHQLQEQTQQQYENASASIRELESRRIILQSQLAQLAGGYQEREDSLRAELAAAREKFTDIHPKVQNLRRALAALAEEKKAGTSVISSDVQGAQSRATYIAVQSEYETVVAKLAAEKVRLNKLQKLIDEYKERLERGPEVEQAYLALNRDYENSVKRYTEIKDKQMEAKLSEELEKARKGERLSLLAVPRLPTEPIRPNRLGIMLVGILLASMFGVGTAAIAEFRDHTIHGVSELAAILNTQPIGIIPVIQAGSEAG